MNSVLLLQILTFYLIHLTPLSATGSALKGEETDTSERRRGQASPDGQRPIPVCDDGMKPKAREHLVNEITSFIPNIEYACNLTDQTSLEAEISSGGFAHDGPVLLFGKPRRSKYRARDFVDDAVKEWEYDLTEVTNRNAPHCRPNCC
ncbi:hypothetical protein Y032_0046g1420 [Ancylostoma ceylanicum]|uniref:Uncharacterized protein n=1 Tax=Ancylostoma ceylanicum TaxID=53326 RepID=A0A016UC89_9BILA|nr:hypothetical protein Y032_0046g1420 [Ancylostoma ceylanicum]